MCLCRFKPPTAPPPPHCMSRAFTGRGVTASSDRCLSQEHVFGFVALVEGRPKAPPAGFILARLAAGEAEILTVAVSKSVRRHGIGQRLVDETLRRLHAERAQSLFLEVDGANLAAINLYKRAGFKKVGERPAYYEGPEGKTAALVMRLDLG